MIEEEKTNYRIAKVEADNIDALIINTLQQGHSFRVEAGAGSGKTYSLNKIIEWIQANKQGEYKRKMQNVICITYTHAAVDVIAGLLRNDSFILPSTIHSFAWNAIRQYQSTLIKIVRENEKLHPQEGDIEGIIEIQYTLGHRYIKDRILYLYHDDVITIFCTLLDNAKFRTVFSNRYPLILVDEYQDSFKGITDRFLEYFISKGIGPQFGYFGDAWQTIYSSNKACGLINHENLVVIKKGSNFRSAPKIVELLNNIRPDLPQHSAIDSFDGMVSVITCDDYTGARRKDKYFKDDLPIDELKTRLKGLSEHIKDIHMTTDESLKILMITHKLLAAQQGYDKLLDIIDDSLKDKDDPFLLFFMETTEQIYTALQTADMQMLFNALGVKRYPINRKSDKQRWKLLELQLTEARNKKTIDVVKVLIDTGLVPIPPQVREYFNAYYQSPDIPYGNATIKEFLELDYTQFLAAIDFLYPEAKFSTEHGVKGEEYDNVIFVIGRGWNQYQFETYAPMIHNGVPKDKEESYIRNRNLFYVCCSRPKKRLFFFVTIPVDRIFYRFLADLVGQDNITTYNNYINR